MPSRAGASRTGGAIAALGAAWSILAVTVIVPAAGDDGSDFYGRYDEVGGSPGGIAETALTEPWRLFEVAFDGRGGEYLAELLLPLAALPLLAPAALLIALPELALNLLSSTVTQQSIHFHYTAGVVPGLVVAAVFGAARLARLRPGLETPLGVVVCGTALVSAVLLGPVPDRIDDYRRDGHDRAAAAAVDLIPAGEPVSATNTLGAHLSERRRVFSWPVVGEARWIAVDERRPSLGDRLNPPQARARIAALRRSEGWRIVFERDGILVLQRDRLP